MGMDSYLMTFLCKMGMGMGYLYMIAAFLCIRLSWRRTSLASASASSGTVALHWA